MTAEMVMELSEIYDQDVDMMAQMEDVTFLLP
jgi:hypothetical protein